MSAIQSMFARHGSAFSEDKATDICRSFTLPATIFVRDRILRCETESELATCISQYRARLVQEGMHSVSKRLVNLTPLRNGSHLAVLENRYFDARCVQIGASLARHWCRSTAEGPRIELVEYLQLPMGLVPDDFPFLRGV